VTEGTVEEFSLLPSDAVITAAENSAEVENVPEDSRTGFRAWGATELIGDYARPSDGRAYGYVADLGVEDDRIAAVIVARTAPGNAGVPEGFPYSSARWPQRRRLTWT